ncbi:MAG: hypothetical protein ACP5IL_10960 [Syntrophobacteraceae bacterium]
MKVSAFFLLVSVAVLAVYGLWGRMVWNKPACLSGIVLADRVETNDSITYSTDPRMEEKMRRENEEEKEKEYNSWKMLQNMPFYYPLRKSAPPRPGAAPAN